MMMQQVVVDLLVYKVKYRYVVRLYCFAEASRIRHEVPTSHFERKGRGAGGHEVNCSPHNKLTGT